MPGQRTKPSVAGLDTVPATGEADFGLLVAANVDSDGAGTVEPSALAHPVRRNGADPLPPGGRKARQQPPSSREAREPRLPEGRAEGRTWAPPRRAW